MTEWTDRERRIIRMLEVTPTEIWGFVRAEVSADCPPTSVPAVCTQAHTHERTCAPEGAGAGAPARRLRPVTAETVTPSYQDTMETVCVRSGVLAYRCLEHHMPIVECRCNVAAAFRRGTVSVCPGEMMN